MKKADLTGFLLAKGVQGHLRPIADRILRKLKKSLLAGGSFLFGGCLSAQNGHRHQQGGQTRRHDP